MEHLHALHCIAIRHVSTSTPVWLDTAAARPAVPGRNQGCKNHDFKEILKGFKVF